MPRLLHAAASFVIVLVSYWVYALAAVPLIEPAADLQRAEQITEEQRAAAQRSAIARVKQFEGLFPPGAWELKNPTIFDGDRVKLLMQGYHNWGQGRLKIDGCTMVFTPDETVADPLQRKQQAVILEAPQGALLEFDQPLDLRRMKIGRLVAGKLNGQITIRSKGKKPGPEDDLLIKTRDVQLTEHNVWTPYAVDFQLGPNYGRGSQMRIKLLPSTRGAQRSRRGPDVGGVELFELRHLQRLHLELEQATLSPNGQSVGAGNIAAAGLPGEGVGATTPATQPATTSAAQPASGPEANLPVEVTCRGPFRFDLPRKVATFEDQVDVLRIISNGPSDQLNCELLSVFFAERTWPGSEGPSDGKTGSSKGQAGPFDLQAQRIEARGEPVVISAPSVQLHARGERIEYDLQANRIALDGSREVCLQQGVNEIHARSLQYESAGPGRLGRVLAEGPGWLRGQMAQRPGEELEARWNEQLHVRPVEQNQVISLTGGAQVKFRGIGRLDAGEVHLWLLEFPPQQPSEKLRLQPDRMLARGAVRVDSPELSAALEQLEVWFEEQPQGQGAALAAEEYSDAAADAVPAGGQIPAASPSLAATVYRPVAGEQTAPPLPARQQHFQIRGRLLQARVLVHPDRQTELSELTVEDGVHFVETQTAQPGEQPLAISGDCLHAVDADKPHAAVSVAGNPAHFEGRGLGLTGANINLNRGTNRLWIDGPGEMDLPLDRDLEGHPLPNPGKLNVRWQRRMEFDGRTVQFEEQVIATGLQQTLRTEALEVQLRQMIHFSDPEMPTDTKPKDFIEQIRCRGGVSMDGRSFQGQMQISQQRMQVADLAVNFVSGELTANGPGSLVSVRRGSGGLWGGQSEAPPDPYSGLRCLHVQFQGPVTGDVIRREMSFHDQVQAAYAPVDSWNATLRTDNPDALGPGGANLHCDCLSLVEMDTPQGRQRELEATGNVGVEGSTDQGTFTARAVRMAYAEAKNLLVLEGDGRSDAELFRQQQIGGPISKAAARKILYWPKTQWSKERLIVEGARSLELSQLTGGISP